MKTLADIAVPVNLFKTFHYAVPPHLADDLVIGSRVVVPFGSRRVTGTVAGFPEQTETPTLREIVGLAGPPLSPDRMKLAFWMADYYLHPLGLTIETLLPRGVEETKPKRVRLLRLLSGDHDMDLIRGPKQAALFLLLSERLTVPTAELKDFAPSTIKALCAAGIAEVVEEEDRLQTDDETFMPDAAPELMPEQAAAVGAVTAAIAQGTFETFLLHGVTASGKTEVYLQCIGSLVGTGKGAIVLVPEIALTPQLLGRFRKRFGSRVAMLHSAMTDRERADEYRRIGDGAVDVAIGARSAVFAPFPRLGLVVVDEEHENSYKQDEGLRYHGRDVAVMRAKMASAVCVLGSATPSLESAYNAREGKYRRLVIANRVDHRPMPEVEILDLKAGPQKSLLTPRLVSEVRARLDRKEQALLLLNRRGFSSVLICEDCGKSQPCPSCSVSLTFHKNERKLKCHYCDHQERPPEACPLCGGPNLKPLGTGTQKIEEEVAAAFPGARIERMDSDRVRGRHAYDKLLGRVDRGEVDILLGTQMIAKGHDFPSVTLVGVADADVGLNLPDFRSAEKTFQLITQAAGRAGRGATAGEVIIQTLNPGHYALRYSRTHDYGGFYDEEIRFRQELGYPPFGRMIKIEVKASQEQVASDASRTAQNRIRHLQRGQETSLLGPAPSPIARVRGKYRFQMILLSKRRELVRQLAVEARKAVEEKFGRKVQVIVDVDPVNLM